VGRSPRSLSVPLPSSSAGACAGHDWKRPALFLRLAGLPERWLTIHRYHDSFDVMKQVILRKVPDELHRQVKTAAASAGLTMQDWIIVAMQREVEKGKPRK